MSNGTVALVYLRKLTVIVALKCLMYFEGFALSTFCGYVEQAGEGQLRRRAQYVTLTAPTPQADSPH